MTQVQWVELETALAIHDRNVQLFGGSDGIRDLGLLESALHRARNLSSYREDATMFELAASIAHGIVKNHPFVDGNKRTGFLVAALFLAKNGMWLMATEPEAAIAVLELAAGDMDEAAFSQWLQSNCRAIQPNC